ncbi:MAG: hypothetical protein GXP61_05885 [Epsilonproteobacteria bacterium]|nr:hypothetical protein [Campylobacterota bacterium]
MEHLFFSIFIGVVISLSVFLLFERKAIASKRLSQKEGLHGENITLPESFQRYETEKNVIRYSIIMFLFTIILSYSNFFTQNLTLIDVFLYVFLTTFIGSTIIFILKIKRSLLIKVFAAFLYGAPLIFSSALGFIITYVIYEKFIL